MIRCVVFDFDGTLVDSNHIKRQVFFEVARDFPNGPEVMRSIVERDDAGDRYWVFKRFIEAMSLQLDSMELAGRYTRLCERRIAGAAEIPGASMALSALKDAGMQLFVNSATPEEPLRRLIELRKMRHWFEGIYGAPREKHENIEVIMGICRIGMCETLMIGDGEQDRMAADIVGCHFIGVSGGAGRFKKQPLHLIRNLRNLPEFVANIG